MGREEWGACGISSTNAGSRGSEVGDGVRGAWENCIIREQRPTLN
jgi:hypothetical protein